MSISQTKNFFEKTGCGVSVLVAIGLVMAIGLFSGGNCRNQSTDGTGTASSKDLGPAIMTVGKTIIPEAFFRESFEAAVNNQEAEIQSQITKEGDFEGLAPRDYAILNGQVLVELRKSAYLNEIAAENGVTFDFKGAKEYSLKKLEKAIIDGKNQLIKDKKLAANANKESVDKGFMDAYGNTPDGIRAEQTKRIDEVLSDPLKAFALTRATAVEALTEKLALAKNITDAELDAEFESFKVKMIGFAGSGMTTEEMKKASEAAKADLEKGMSFEAAMEKYSKIPTSPGKKISEEVLDIPASLLSMSPGLNGIRPLKDGEISPILTLETGPTIYKLIKKEKKYPEGFAENKSLIKEKMATQRASVELNEKLEAKLKVVKTEYADPSIEAMIEVVELGRTPDARNVITLPKWKELAEKLGKLVDSGKSGQSAIYGFYAASAEANSIMKPDEQKTFAPTFIKASEEILKIHNNATLRLQIADLLIAQKNPESADQIFLAAEANQTYGPMGLSNHQAIDSKVEALKKANLMPAPLLEKITKSQAEWIKTQKAFDAERKEAALDQKKADEQERLAQEQARLEEEKAKKEAAAQSGATPDPDKPANSAGPSSGDLLGGGTAPATGGN